MVDSKKISLIQCQVSSTLSYSNVEDCTPLTINIEHNHGGLVQIIVLFKWVICRFHVNLQRCRSGCLFLVHPLLCEWILWILPLMLPRGIDHRPCPRWPAGLVRIMNGAARIKMGRESTYHSVIKGGHFCFHWVQEILNEG